MAKDVSNNIITLNGVKYSLVDEMDATADSITLDGRTYEPLKEKVTPTFKLHFKREGNNIPLPTGKTEGTAVPIHVEKDYITLDLKPILSGIFGEENLQEILHSFSGVSYTTENVSEGKKALSAREVEGLLNDLSSLVQSSFVNQKQALGFNNITRRLLDDVFYPWGF